MLEAAETETVRRRWWIAALLALLALAPAYLYVGKPLRAVLAAAFSLALMVAASTGLGGFLATANGVYAGLTLAAAATLLVIFDATRIAREEEAYRLRPFNRLWVYAAVFALVGILPSWLLPPAVRSFAIASGSMQPALQPGDLLLADLHRRSPRRGDVIVFQMPRDPRVLYISRVVGVGGDTVRVTGNVLTINGTPVTLAATSEVTADGTVFDETLPGGVPYRIIDRQHDAIGDETPSYSVPADSYFVMGDNRDNATDSRVPASQGGVGYVPADNIIGTAGEIYWSHDLSRVGLRVD